MYTQAEKDLMKKMENIKTIPYTEYLNLMYGLFILKAMADDCKEKEKANILADLLIKFAFKVGYDRFSKTEKDIRLDILDSDLYKRNEELYGNRE